MQVALICILLVIITLVVRTNKLTVAGGIGGGVLAIVLYAGTGVNGILLLAAFFVPATLATSWSGAGSTQQLPRQEHGPRKLSQVVANGGVAGLLAAIAILDPGWVNLATLLIACSFSSATADTLSSELGSIYGKGFFNIITLKPDLRGEDGVVSVAGFLIGIAGSLLVALVYLLAVNIDYTAALIIICSGTIGNITDSIAGALLERKGLIKNDAVNLINTISAASFGWLLTIFS